MVLIALAFVVESAVVRHYGFAVVFISPLTVLLADAPASGQVAPEVLIHTLLLDTVLRSLAGPIGD